MLEKDIRYIEEYKNENERQFNDSMTLSEIEEERENPPDPNMEEMFEQFRLMLENVEKLPRDNFKKTADIELTKMIQTSEGKKFDREMYLEHHPNFTDC